MPWGLRKIRKYHSQWPEAINVVSEENAVDQRGSPASQPRHPVWSSVKGRLDSHSSRCHLHTPPKLQLSACLACSWVWTMVLFLLNAIFNKMVLTLHHYGLLTAADSLTNVHCGNMFLAIMTEQPTKCYMCELLAFLFTLSKMSTIWTFEIYVLLKFCLGRVVEFCSPNVFFIHVKSTL